MHLVTKFKGVNPSGDARHVARYVNGVFNYRSLREVVDLEIMERMEGALRLHRNTDDKYVSSAWGYLLLDSKRNS